MKSLFFERLSGICLISIAPLLALAQNNDAPQRNFAIGIGITNVSVRDESIAHLTYSATGVSPTFLFNKATTKKYRELSIHPLYLNPDTRRGNSLAKKDLAAFRLQTDYLYLFRSSQLQPSKPALYYGPSASLLLSYRNAPQADNSAISYDYAFSFGAAGKIDKNIRTGKQTRNLSYTINIPLVSHIARPYYQNRIEFIDPENNFINDIFKKSQITTLNRFFRINSQLKLTQLLPNGNALQLTYAWDFYRVETINKAFSAEHLLSFSILFNY